MSLHGNSDADYSKLFAKGRVKARLRQQMEDERASYFAEVADWEGNTSPPWGYGRPRDSENASPPGKRPNSRP